MGVTRRSLPVLALAACLLLPATAAASRTQLSIIQDDRVFWGSGAHDSVAAMREAKALGVDVVRTNMVWQYVSPAKRARRKPSGFDIADPDSPGYHWNAYDHLVKLARQNGLKVLMTISGPSPHWGSRQPSRCRRNCIWKPRPDRFGAFVAAVAKRYRGKVWMYSVWNEPNLGKWLLPQRVWTRHGAVDVAGRTYRRLWRAAYRSIARHNPAKRRAVLFGETAAIAEPVPTLLAALCLNEFGRPFSGYLRRLHGCLGRVRRLPIAGVAHHPYNRLATGSWRTTGRRAGSLSIARLPRLHRLIRIAARRGRIPSRRRVFVTEFGYQSRPPDHVSGLRLRRHAQVLNESERLFFGDPRVRTVSQYNLFDAPGFHAFQTGLMFKDGRRKPAYDAYQMPFVVTRLSRRRVEVWGAVRPASGPTQVHLVGRNPAGTPRVSRTLFTNSAGYFRYRIGHPQASRLRWRVAWNRLASAGQSELVKSRKARAGHRPRYARG